MGVPFRGEGRFGEGLRRGELRRRFPVCPRLAQTAAATYNMQAVVARAVEVGHRTKTGQPR